MSMDAALIRLPECVACNQGVDENDASTPYTIVKGEHVHLKCSVVTELSAAYAKEVHDYLTEGPNRTRAHSPYVESLLDEEETEELVESYLLGTPAIEFAKRLENRDIAAFERACETQAEADCCRDFGAEFRDSQLAAQELKR